MKILQFCSKVPNPPKDGGSIAMDNLTKGLLQLGAEVKVFALSTYKHPFDESVLSSEYKASTKIEAVEIDTRIKPIAAFLNLFGSDSYNVCRFYNKEAEQKLIELLNSTSYDIVQLETLFVTPYLQAIRKHSKAKIVFRSQNLEFVIWQRKASNEKNSFVRRYLRLLAKRLERYESDLLNRYDGIAAITYGDADQFRKMGCTVPVRTIPFGIDLKTIQLKPGIHPEPNSCFHIGAMNWEPNCEAVKWLIEEVWPLVEKKNSAMKLYLAGRFMPDWIIRLNRPSVQVIGEVKNQYEFMQSKDVMLVPLLSGGGMRIKIIEGMAAGKAIISTRVGAEGIPCENGKTVLFADTAEEFASQIVRCAENGSLTQRIGQQGKVLVHEQFDNVKICKNLLRFYTELLQS